MFSDNCVRQFEGHSMLFKFYLILVITDIFKEFSAMCVNFKEVLFLNQSTEEENVIHNMNLWLENSKILTLINHIRIQSFQISIVQFLYRLIMMSLSVNSIFLFFIGKNNCCNILLFFVQYPCRINQVIKHLSFTKIMVMLCSAKINQFLSVNESKITPSQIKQISH